MRQSDKNKNTTVVFDVWDVSLIRPMENMYKLTLMKLGAKREGGWEPLVQYRNSKKTRENQDCRGIYTTLGSSWKGTADLGNYVVALCEPRVAHVTGKNRSRAK